MAKKTQKRQTTIVSLSDRNQKELQDIRDQKEQILKEYEDKKQGKVTELLVRINRPEHIITVSLLLLLLLLLLVLFGSPETDFVGEGGRVGHGKE